MTKEQEEAISTMKHWIDYEKENKDILTENNIYAKSQNGKWGFVDKDGNVVDEEGDETTTVEEPINPEDVRTPENYKEVKDIIEKRLKFMGVNDYTIGLNEGNGSIVLDMTDNSRTDTIAEYMYMQGRFQITDADTDEVLIDYTQITDVNYAYTSYGTGVYIIIEFNDEGKQKLNEISTTYVQSTDADGNDTTKNVQISVDDEVLTESYFSQENTTGRLELNIGSTPTTTADLENNIMQAAGITSVLKYGLLPVSYNLDENRYISSEIPHEIIYLAAIVVGVITIITLIVINVIWNDKPSENQDNKTTSDANKKLAVDNQNVDNTDSAYNDVTQTQDAMETKLADILSNINGVGKVKVMITYSETSKTMPVYNEESSEENTEETDSEGGTRKITQTDVRKEVIYEEGDNGKTLITQSVVSPSIAEIPVRI